jgi:myo-inositol-1(or 4)-monophosphatase
MRNYPDAQYIGTLAREAGEIMKRGFGFVQKLKVEWKGDNTQVTANDHAINSLVVESFKRDFPHIQLFSEEGDRNVENAEYVAYCDPIDGTAPYALGIPVSTFCLSVVKKGVPLVAVLYNPFSQELWGAMFGSGCYLNGREVRVSTHRSLERASVSAAWTNGSDLNDKLLNLFPHLDARGGSWFNYRAAAYGGGQVASGVIHGSVFAGKKALETATMQLIVEEAGGRATDIDGNPLVYDGPEIKGHVISNGHIHDQLLEFLRS